LKRILLIVTVVGGALLGTWLFRILFPGDERLIRQLIAQVADAVSIKPNEHPLVKLGAANKLGNFFSEHAVISYDAVGLDSRTINGREELIQIAAAARANLQNADIRLLDVYVLIDADKQSASANVVASATINGSKEPLVQEFKITLKKFDGDWLITRADSVRTLGR
jgi:hypothetical protein